MTCGSDYFSQPLIATIAARRDADVLGVVDYELPVIWPAPPGSAESIPIENRVPADPLRFRCVNIKNRTQHESADFQADDLHVHLECF